MKSRINSSNTDTYLADEVHPNALGGELMSTCIINGVKYYELHN